MTHIIMRASPPVFPLFFSLSLGPLWNLGSHLGNSQHRSFFWPFFLLKYGPPSNTINASAHSHTYSNLLVITRKWFTCPSSLEPTNPTIAIHVYLWIFVGCRRLLCMTRGVDARWSVFRHNQLVLFYFLKEESEAGRRLRGPCCSGFFRGLYELGWNVKNHCTMDQNSQESR